MSQPSIVLQAMQPDRWYEPLDLHLKTQLREDDVKESLRMLVRGGIVEADGPLYKRKKKYRL